MEFNLNSVLENLKEKGDALASFGKKDDDLIKVKGEEVKELSDKKDKDVATETILETGDASIAEEINKEKEGVITTKDKKKESASDLEKKLANIEKVIDKFSGGTTTLPSSKDLVGNSNSNINIKPLDFGQMQAKADQQEYLKPSSVPNDRIALLYKDLEKYNLI
jgi:hypothetical protein